MNTTETVTHPLGRQMEIQRKNMHIESEIAFLRKRIEQECVALRLALDGFAVSASHEAITARYERLGAYQEELEKHLGRKAKKTTCEIYMRQLG